MKLNGNVTGNVLFSDTTGSGNVQMILYKMMVD